MQDLFEYPEIWPANLRAILFAYITKDQTYANILQLERDLENLGYSIEYGLDCMAYNLQKVGPN
jgi:hypothetical protein